ncbi:type VI secretion system contractile sheath small subunit [Bartonella sp. LJL80]
MARGTREGSVAPKERINIKYTPATLGQQEEKELPLRLFFVGDYTGRHEDTAIEERKVLSVDKNTFAKVMEEQNIRIDITVPNTLSGNKDDELKVSLNIASLSDFSPDAIAKQIPEIKKLLDLRENINALKGPLGNMPSFRNAVQNIIEDPQAREKILKEISSHSNPLDGLDNSTKPSTDSTENRK